MKLSTAVCKTCRVVRYLKSNIYTWLIIMMLYLVLFDKFTLVSNDHYLPYRHEYDQSHIFKTMGMISKSTCDFTMQ